MPLPTRFWEKVNKRGPVPTEKRRLGRCWLWCGALSNLGYGNTYYNGKYWKAHRLTYTELIGPIPGGAELDHLCRIRNCVNPKHLEPVSHRENTRRGDAGKHLAARTHCPKGHPYDEDSTRYKIRASGVINRLCKKCAADYQRRKKLAASKLQAAE